MIRYTRILVCPKTGKQVGTNAHYYNSGICEVCGDEQMGTICHAQKEVGHWEKKFSERKGWSWFYKNTWVPKDA